MANHTMDQFNQICEKLRAKSRNTDNHAKDNEALHLEDDNVAAFVDALQLSKDRVQTLSLNISLLTGQAPGLDRLLKFIENSGPSLREVRLLGSDYRSTALNSIVKRFLVAIHKKQNVERLTLYKLGLDFESFARLVRNSQTLFDLTLYSCSITDGGNNSPISMGKVGEAFAVNRSIERLRLVELHEELLNTILQPMKTHRGLRKLDVAYGSVASAEAIGEVIGSSVTTGLGHLVLRDSSLLHLEPIVRNLSTTTSTVQKLEIQNCDLDSVSAALLRSLFRTPYGKKIRSTLIEDVTLCDVDVEDESDLEDLFYGIARSSNVKRLKVHHVGCNMTMETNFRALEALLHMLKNNRHLQVVNLDRKLLAAIGVEPSTSGSKPKDGRDDTQHGSSSSKLFFSRRTGTTELGSVQNSKSPMLHKNSYTL